MRLALHGVAVILLTLLTQVGGLAWLVALCFRRRWLAFPLAYAAPWTGAVFAAPAREHPGTMTLALDGMPLVPHLSHNGGEKLDWAFFHADPNGRYQPGRICSPLGCFAFERKRAEPCPPAAPTLRLDRGWLQPLRADQPLEPWRTTALIRHLVGDERVGKVFLEPPLARSLGPHHPKLRFQGCRAARHDDHIHVELRGLRRPCRPALRL